MLHRGTGIVAPADEAHPSSTREAPTSNSSSARNGIDRQTSALNRRILPHHVDGRSREAKRLVGLVQDLAKRVQSPDDPVTRARLVGAALLIMQQESMAHAVAAGQVVNPDDVVRVAHATERALERLA